MGHGRRAEGCWDAEVKIDVDAVGRRQRGRRQFPKKLPPAMVEGVISPSRTYVAENSGTFVVGSVSDSTATDESWKPTKGWTGLPPLLGSVGLIQNTLLTGAVFVPSAAISAL